MENKSIKVLFIDDETAFIDTLIKRLKKRNICALGADCGEVGIVLLDNIQLDIVVLDICMPGMNAIHTLENIKTKWPFVEVIMLNDHACLEIARQGMEKGAYDYLIKPIDIDELTFKIEDAFDKIQVSKKNFITSVGKE